MNSLYEIDQRMLALVDQETGELKDEAEFLELQMERDEKIENMALWYKDLTALAASIKAEENALKDRRESIERKASNLLSYLSNILDGQKFQTAKVNISYRKSSKCVPSENFVQWAEENERFDLLKYGSPSASLSEIKKAILSGDSSIPAKIIETKNIGVK